ncbi:putative fumarylacetoacetase [Plasmopara halstedii]
MSFISITPDNFPKKSVGVAIGEFVLDLAAIANEGYFQGFDASCFNESTLNKFMAQGPRAWALARATVQRLLSANEPKLRDDEVLWKRALIPAQNVCMHLPAEVGDYTDFFSSREHATNVGRMFRGEDNALQPYWLHLPVGYHGRSFSIIVSGTNVRRPCGQLQADKTDPSKGSVYGPCRVLDFELEMVKTLYPVIVTL